MVQRDATDATVLQNARAEDADSLTVESPSTDLPTGCLVVMVSRDGEDSVPDPDTRLRHGDHLTLVCQENEAMRDAVERCRSGN